jgi:hypothetical protein
MAPVDRAAVIRGARYFRSAQTKEIEMKTVMLMAAFTALALPAYAAPPTHKFSPPAVSKQQEQAYNQTYTSDMAQEKQLKAGGKTQG